MFFHTRKTQTKYLICNSNLVAASDSRNMAHFCVSACVAKSQQNFIAVVIISCAVPHSHAPARPLLSPPHLTFCPGSENPAKPATYTRWSYAVLCLKISNAWHFGSETAASHRIASRAPSDSQWKNINNTNKDTFPCLPPLLVLLLAVGFSMRFSFSYLFICFYAG